jgi:hypothetical protein
MAARKKGKEGLYRPADWIRIEKTVLPVNMYLD